LCDGFHRERNGAFQHEPIPCLVARYNPSDWSFVVTPLNERARAHYSHCNGVRLSEQRFVRSLHLLRKAVLTAEDEAAIAALNCTANSVRSQPRNAPREGSAVARTLDADVRKS